jgi:hypothetical protein
MSDASSKVLTPEQITFTGFDKDSRGVQTITASYGAAKCQFKVSVVLPEGIITVGFALLGTTVHGDILPKHTLRAGNLTEWIAEQDYQVSNNYSVLDLLTKVLGENELTFVNSGNYIKSITKDGVTLAEFSNGPNSGWMYILNGIHSQSGVEEQLLNDGDAIVFHYTDDWTVDETFDLPTDFTALNAAIAEALALREADYIATKWADLQSALTAAQVVAANAAATQQEVNKAITSLKLAIFALVEIADSYEETLLEDLLATVQAKVADPQVNSEYGEWAVLALARAGVENNELYANYLANLKAFIETQAYSVDDQTGKVVLDCPKITENERVILTLTALGIDASAAKIGDKTYDFTAVLADKQWFPDKDDSRYQASWQGTNGAAFALIALDSNNYLSDRPEVREYYVDYLLSSALPGGGWAISGADSGLDYDVSAMAIQALAPYYGSNAEVKAVVDSALARLVLLSVDNSEGATQMIVALTSLGLDPANYEGTDYVAILLTYFDQASGGFEHTYEAGFNQMATEQAAYALVAYDRFVNGKGGLYDMSDASTIFDGSFNIPDNTPDDTTDDTPDNTPDNDGHFVGQVGGIAQTRFSGQVGTAVNALAAAAAADNAESGSADAATTADTAATPAARITDTEAPLSSGTADGNGGDVWLRTLIGALCALVALGLLTTLIVRVHARKKATSGN